MPWKNLPLVPPYIPPILRNEKCNGSAVLAVLGVLRDTKNEKYNVWCHSSECCVSRIVSSWSTPNRWNPVAFIICTEEENNNKSKWQLHLRCRKARKEVK